MITWNSYDKSDKIILSENNLCVYINSINYPAIRSTEGKTYGKWYWEIEYQKVYNNAIGICSKNFNFSDWLGNKSNERVYFGHRGEWWNNGHSITPPRHVLKIGDIVGFMLDMDKKTIQININGILQPDIISFNIDEAFPVFGKTTSDSKYPLQITANFGNSKFNLYNSNISLYYDLIKNGYKPYDIENANWNWSLGKYLIKYDSDYYLINSNYIKLGHPINNEQLEYWFDKYGAIDMNIILKNLYNKQIPITKNDKTNIWKTDFGIDFNDVNNNIELTKNNFIKYNCDRYKIIDIISHLNKLINIKIYKKQI